MQSPGGADELSSGGLLREGGVPEAQLSTSELAARMENHCGHTALDKAANDEIVALLTAAEAAAQAGAAAPPPEGKARGGEEEDQEDDTPPPSQGGAQPKKTLPRPVYEGDAAVPSGDDATAAVGGSTDRAHALWLLGRMPETPVIPEPEPDIDRWADPPAPSFRFPPPPRARASRLFPRRRPAAVAAGGGGRARSSPQRTPTRPRSRRPRHARWQWVRAYVARTSTHPASSRDAATPSMGEACSWTRSPRPRSLAAC